MKRLLLLASVMLAGVFCLPSTAGATGLKVAPLEYRTTLKKGETKKGFIDASNPTDQTVRIKTSAQAFRQVDDSGSLQFFDHEQIRTGIQLDLDEFELGPREAVRMYFQLDGSKLPSGDVFAAIFFTTEPTKPSVDVGQSIRLGTLFSIVNGTPGPREAEITNLTVPWLQLSDTISGSYSIKNTADPNQATGFYPTVQLQAAPLGEAKKQTGKLIFAGITRTNEFSLKVFPLGIYQVSAGYMGSKQSSWVVVASPVAMLVVAVIVILGIVAGRYAWKQRARSAFSSSKSSLK